ncbi:hypothetical protein LCGC14_2382460 [marine sediment metagenome]|uniref:Uncharacterized protein n=1 Tax=marine sediment metagenome TaxID=412755 RepID=A0A0F9C0L0_9ZZZZ|nr:hypothetical protein [bacterium]
MTELEKWDNVYEDSVTITEFLDFLSSRGINLSASTNNGFYPITTTYTDLIYEYFSIDKDKLERERRELLDGIKK